MPGDYTRIAVGNSPPGWLRYEEGYASAAEFASEMDMGRARQAKDDAEKRMGDLNYEDKDFNSTEAALRWANARLEVAGKEVRR